MARMNPADSLLARQKCAGAPLGADGQYRQRINDCPFPPKWVCVGLVAGADGEPLTCVVLACSIHRSAVVEVVSMDDPDSTLVVEIDALPAILDELGSDVWTLQPGQLAA